MLNTSLDIDYSFNLKHLLSNTQKESYRRDGFLILNHFISTNLCEMLVEQARKLIMGADLDGFKTIFSTVNKQHEYKQYFLTSGDKIRYFFEENAFDEEGRLKADKLFCINKIGHALHDLDPIFYCFSRLAKIAALIKELGLIDPRLIQSMYIYKQPHIGGEVASHQDSTYLFVKDEPITGLWFALEEANIENGCLWAIPGGHLTGLKSRFIVDDNNQMSTEVYDNTAWPLEKMIPLEVPRGSLIILHGYLPHMSKENHSAKSRQAYTLHVSSSQCEFAKDNWLKRSADFPFSGFA